jgi:hypothetical protein
MQAGTNRWIRERQRDIKQGQKEEHRTEYVHDSLAMLDAAVPLAHKRHLGLRADELARARLLVV